MSLIPLPNHFPSLLESSISNVSNSTAFTNKNKFLSPNFNSLSDIKVTKPKAPTEPKELIIKKIQKDIKEGE